MIYTNYPYGMFNPQYLQNYRLQNSEVQRNFEQQKNICDMVKVLSDFLEASRKIDSDYQQAAMNACLAEIIRQASKDNGGNF